MKKVYHVTTTKKWNRCLGTGAILPPVRYWTSEYSALRWAKKTGRNIIIVFREPSRSYPLPIKGGAKWSDSLIMTDKCLVYGEK